MNQFFTFLSVDSCLSDLDIFTDCKALPLLCGDTGSAEKTGAIKLDEYSRLCEYEAAYSLLNDNGNNFPQWFAAASKKINSKKSVLVYSKSCFLRLRRACVYSADDYISKHKLFVRYSY